MDKTYQPDRIEAHWSHKWDGLFAPSGQGAPYAILIPPPNITGCLHMGHAFQSTIMDTLVRFKRMQGHNTLWQVGIDHAGIATQIAVAHDTRYDIGRDAFIDKIWEWKREYGDHITRQLRSMGASVDWSRERFTMDEGFYKLTKEVFVRLYDSGLIYRGKRMVNWDPALLTAISDLEVEKADEQCLLWHLRYPLADGVTTKEGNNHVVVATTRPETVLGDTCIAVHPDDSRYQSIVGAFVELPLVCRRIPIVADEYVDRDFGTGCVKVTPAHDFNDYELGKRHNSVLINILTHKATICQEADIYGSPYLKIALPAGYAGLSREEARKKVIADFEALGLLDKISAHTLKVPRCDRSGVRIEPLLTDQWFVAINELASPAIHAVERGYIRFVPNNYENMYFAWMRDLQDWCISRQLWWGHRIPAWLDAKGNVYVANSEAEAILKYGLDADLRQDEDVLDTWFSSSLWTFGTLGWDTSELATFHPTNTLVTGFDIIFFWVARMIMMTLKFTGDVPFNTVYIHGLVRDADGHKMSKSRGNVLDPIDVPHGTDALRYTLLSLASPGRDIKFDMGRLKGYRNFCNKLWNAARYVKNHTELTSTELTIADRFIVSRLQQTSDQITRHLDSYRFDLAAQTLYSFVWYEYCDWYIELSKQAQKRGTTMLRVLEKILRLAHPMMPFISEEIWQRVAPKPNATLMTQQWPVPDLSCIDHAAIADIEWLKQVIVAVRNIRAEMNIAPGRLLPLYLTSCNAEDRRRLQENLRFLTKLAKLESAAKDTIPVSAIVGTMEVRVPLDKQAEMRIIKQISQQRALIKCIERKLANQNFIDRAPAAVVDHERKCLTKAKAAIARLELQEEQNRKH